MCINYKAVDLEDLDKMMEGRLAAVERDWPDEIWRDSKAPIIRATEDGKPELIIGTYGITPQRAYKEKKQARDTMNARIETIGELRSFASA